MRQKVKGKVYACFFSDPFKEQIDAYILQQWEEAQVRLSLSEAIRSLIERGLLSAKREEKC